MSTIYDIDTDQQVIELLPPDKRFPNMVAWLQDVLRGTVQWLRDAALDKYRNGSTDPEYAAGTYAYGAFVIYQNGVYVSLKANNTDDPTVSTSWYKMQDNFIGISERVLYNGQTIVLEYALNRWFKTTFRQPGAGTSDIFLLNNAKPTAIFITGGNEANSSVSFGGHSTEYSINAYSFGAFKNFNIHIPVAVYNALDTIASNRDNIVRAFADKYVNAGILYAIVTY